MGERYARGAELLKKIHARAGEEVLDSYGLVAPDLSRYITEFAYGDIYSRPGFSLSERQLFTIVCLTALGDAHQELEVHIASALNVGVKPESVVEAILHCIPYVGFPRAMNAMAIAQSVFSKTLEGNLPANKSGGHQQKDGKDEGAGGDPGEGKIQGDGGGQR